MGQTQISGAAPRKAEAIAPRRRHWRILGWLLALFAAVLVLQTGLDWAVHRPNASRRLTARLAAAFGRPVEVGRYDVTLWSGPRLLAQSVVVAEDPRFGNEYFLRADSLAMRVRWLPLLRGRIALGALSFGHPSMNLAINPNGRVNLADWLPRREGGAAARGAPAFSRVNLNAGRINFKSGDLKLPFALTVVNGFIEQQAGGRWRISLDAQPMRAAVLLQRVGTLHLEGTVGGTTSRLRPADLQVSWSQGSVADLLRFLRGDDMGARGDFSLEFAAHAAGPSWNLAGQGQARRLHRWDLPLRSDNPSFNFTASGVWLPDSGQLRISSAQFQAPHSNGRLSGSFGWGSFRWGAGGPMAMKFPDEGNLALSAAIGAPDGLAFLRAFRAGIAEQLAARGEVAVNLRTAGWPPALDAAHIATDGITLEGGSLAAPLNLAPVSLSFDAGKWLLPETQLVFPPAAGAFSLLIHPARGKAPQPPLEIAGQADDARQVSTVAAALGYALPRGWDVSGPLEGRAELAPGLSVSAWRPAGKITLDGVIVRVPFLVRPIGPVTAQLDFSPRGEFLHLRRAAAFGSNWSGELTHDRGGPSWHGDLAADAMDIARFNDFINPAKRQSLLNRIFPLLASPGAQVSVPESLRWSGRLRVDDFLLQQLHLSHMRANARLDRRVVELDDAEAEVGHGQIIGSFTARLNSKPDYHADLHLQGVDLAALEGPSVAERLDGVVTGDVKLSAAGLTHQTLAASLQCQGQASATGLTLKAANLAEPDGDGVADAGESHFRLAHADFRCAAQRVNFTGMTLLHGNVEFTGHGTGGFDHSLDFILMESSIAHESGKKPGRARQSESSPSVSQPSGEIHLTGTLDAPRMKINSGLPHP
jgi:hypothetical protein